MTDNHAYYEDVPPPSATRPYPPPASLRLSEPAPAPHRKTPALAIGAYLIGIAALMLAAYCAWSLASAKATVAHQATQLATMHKALTKAQQAASKYASLSGRVGTLENGMASLAPFNKTCSTDLTGPNGPAEFFFMCTDQRPG
jgi:hypothetical protein